MFREQGDGSSGLGYLFAYFVAVTLQSFKGVSFALAKLCPCFTSANIHVPKSVCVCMCVYVIEHVPVTEQHDRRARDSNLSAHTGTYSTFKVLILLQLERLMSLFIEDDVSHST